MPPFQNEIEDEVVIMYCVTVETKFPEFIAYLKEEATFEEPRTYCFSDFESACKTISRYMLYFLRQCILDDLILQKKMNEHKKEDFLLYISSDDIVSVLQSIQQKVHEFLLQNETLHFEGFTQFRLKEEKHRLNDTIQQALKSYVPQDTPTANLDVLEEILREQTTKEELLYMILEPNNRIILRSEERIFLSEHTKNEDMVLSHLIVLAPKVVKVHETHGQLTRETVIILRHLFKDKVAFTREKYHANRHSKE